MAISQTAEYALRAMVWLAAHPTGSQSTLQIARGTRVPAGYMSKVMQELARADLVRSRPGRAGGFVLVRGPAGITVLDVVNAVDPVQRIRACPLGIGAHAGRLCPLHARLDEVAEWTERAFAETTIAQLLGGPEPRDALCAATPTVAPPAAALPVAAPVRKRRRRAKFESGRVAERASRNGRPRPGGRSS